MRSTGEAGKEGSSRLGAPTPDCVFPLDGLPLTYPGEPARPLTDGNTDSWSGGFAFAVWDRERQALRAYRDHYGARPLYYHASREQLLLSSEIPALIERLPGPSLDENAVAEYIATGVLTEGDTFYEEIKRVPAASRLSTGPGGIRVERFWHPWAGPWTGSPKPEDLDAEFRRLFRRAVHATLADGLPAGVLLSGGHDSSGILGMAAALAREGALPGGPPRIALTTAFEQLPQCDETALARETAALHGVPWRPVPVEHLSPLSGLDRFLKRFGEPPCTPPVAVECRLFEEARREGVCMLLDGHDADVLFVPSFSYLWELMRRFRWLRLAREWTGLRRCHNFGLRRLTRNTLPPLAHRIYTAGRLRAPGWIRPHLRAELEARLRPKPARASFEERDSERAVLPGIGLALEATRALERLYGIELRHPYFDPKLVRFLFSVPFEHRFCKGETKILMRRALADLLTPAVRRRIQKTHYRVYFDRSLRQFLGGRFAALVKDRSSLLDAYIDTRLLFPMVEATMKGGLADPALWRMIALERWLMLRLGQRKEVCEYEDASAP